MKKSKLAIVLCIMFLSQIVLGQDKHITYLCDVFSVSLAQDTEGNRKSNYKKRKGYLSILVIKDTKAISYRHDTVQSKSNDILNKNRYSTSLFKKKNNKTRALSFFYSERRDKFNFNGFSSNWHQNRPDIEPDFKNESRYMKAILSKAGVDTTFTAPIINYTEKTKTIKGYHCKNAVVKSSKNEYIVWYTKEIDYHWCFDDFCALIPGTPILIEHKGKPQLEFVSIKDLNYDKIWIEKRVVDFILKNWNKKLK